MKPTFCTFKWHILINGLALLTIFGSGCTGSLTPSPQPSLTSTVSPTPPTAIIPVIQDSTRTPFSTITATQIPLPIPAATEISLPVPDFPLDRLAVLSADNSRNLYFLTAAGRQKIGVLRSDDNLTCPVEAAFSPVGHWLAYISDRSLVVGQREQGVFATVVRSEELAANSPPVSGGWIEPSGLKWLPASSQLLFTTLEAGVPFASRRYDLYLFDTRTGKLNRLLGNGKGGETYPDPTGRWVALALDTRISLLDMQTGQVKMVLEYLPISTHTEYYYIPVVEWLPDGSSFLTTLPPADPVMNPQDPTTIWQEDAGSGQTRTLGQITMGFQAQRAYFSPDGSHLAYQWRNALEGPVKIYVASSDGSSARLILSGLYNLEGWTSGENPLQVYDRTARQFAALALDGSLSPVAAFGAFLGGEPLAYRPLEQQLVSNPRFLSSGYSACAWSLLPAGSIQGAQITPFALPTLTASAVPTQKPPPTRTRRPTATSTITVTALPGTGKYQVLATIKAHANAVNALAFQPGFPDFLASGDKDGLISLWNVAENRSLGSLENPGGGVNGLAWSADGQWLASAGGGNEPVVRIWAGNPIQLLHKLDSPGGAFYAISFSPDSQKLAAAGKNGTIRVWEAATGNLIQDLPGHQGSVWGLAFSSDGRTLYSASADQTVRAWALPTGDPLWQENLSQRIFTLALSRDGHWLAAGLENGGIWLSDLNFPGTTKTIPLEKITVNSLAFHPSYPLLAIGNDQGQVLLYDLDANAVINQWTAHQSWVLALAWNLQGTILASGGGEGDNRVILWSR
jgi:WD40 repeat protein